MIYSFGSFQLDTKKRELLSSDRIIHIQPRVYQLLLLLIENRDKALEKEVIQEAIWPGQILSETSLSRLVMKARKALNDKSDNSEYIKTLHGFGFQFVVTVHEIEATEKDDSPQLKQERVTPTKKNLPSNEKNFKVMSFTAFSLILTALLFGLYFPTEQKSDKERILILPIVNETNVQDYEWISLGLPSLVNVMLEQSGEFEIVNPKKLTKEHFNLQNPPKLDNRLIVLLKKEYSASKVIYSKIEKKGELLSLSFSINENTTQAPIYKISATDPTQLAKKLVDKLSHTNSPFEELVTNNTISKNNFVNTLYGKGQSLLLQGYTQKARDIFKVAVTEEPSLFWAHYSYALTSRKLGLWQESKEQLLKLLKHPNLSQINHGESRTRNVLGFTYFRLREYHNALEQFDIAYQLSLETNDHQLQAGIADNIGAIHWINYNFDEARTWLTQSIIIRKKQGINVTGHAYNLLGLLERDQGNLLPAQKQLTKAAELFGESGMLRDYTLVQLNLTTIDEHMGNFDIALQRLNDSLASFIELSEKEAMPFLYRRYASIYLAQNNLHLAENYLKKAAESAQQLKSAVKIAEVSFLRGQLYLVHNKLQETEQSLQKIIPYHEEVWAPYIPFMKLAVLNKNKSNFIKFYEKAKQDADAKNDQLYKLLTETTYLVGMKKLKLPIQQWQKQHLALISQARNMNANKILADQLIISIEFFLENGEFKNANRYLQKLEVLLPEWQLTTTVKFYINGIASKGNEAVKEMIDFKHSHLATWSSKEEQWLNSLSK